MTDIPRSAGFEFGAATLHQFFTTPPIDRGHLRFGDFGRIELSLNHRDGPMPKHHAADVMLDHTHCRAICDEIGERLAQILDREVLEMPPRLLGLLNKFAELERDGPVQLEDAPLIAPSIGDMSLSENREARRAA
jgi:hypothetical protein